MSIANLFLRLSSLNPFHMAIRCAWCGNRIFIGDPITLYTPLTQELTQNNDFQVPENAVVYSKDPLQLVGCLGWNCAESGADRAGFWVPGENGKGRVQRVQTAYEAILCSKEPFIMIVDDTCDIKEAVNPTLVSLESQKAK